MTLLLARLAFVALLAALSFGTSPPAWCQAANPPKPPPPPQTVPDLSTQPGTTQPGSSVTILCVNCDKPFGSAGHKEAMKNLVSNEYAKELRRALFYQDSVHQFESKAHFDNCDFEGATAYVESLLNEADEQVRIGQAAKARKDTAGLVAAGEKAFFSVGQALHAVQDFYAHSNYIELTKDSVKDATDIAVVPIWTPEGKAALRKLQQNGLVSGFVFWGVPQLCSAGAKSHADLAKDSEDTKSGKVRVAHLENLSQYRLAIVAARQASSDFLQYTFKRWPLLGELNGKYVAYEVLVDRRGL